ncbi:MAG: hypothetical protein PSN34_12045 [Urechidicola sp.]|nr:hypothetical protein [Urechidicola sp.]
MSGGAGHIADMNNRMRQNRSMKASNKPKFKSGNRDLNFDTKNSKKLSFKKVSESELKLIKIQIQQDLKKERINQLYIFILSVIIAIIIILLGVFYLS